MKASFVAQKIPAVDAAQVDLAEFEHAKRRHLPLARVQDPGQLLNTRLPRPRVVGQVQFAQVRVIHEANEQVVETLVVAALVDFESKM
jgi:hypothetical protein